MVRLGEYMQNANEDFKEIKQKASNENPWFTPEFTNISVANIAKSYLQKKALEQWVEKYNVETENKTPKKVGIVMAGNIPLVGFHDFLCVFITGHKAVIKASSKDSVLIKYLTNKLIQWEEAAGDYIFFAETLKNCDAYIATGSNNSGRYFEYYFGKYPSIIRKNKTSVAVLGGNESTKMLELLADDIQLFFGLGCRNVSKIFVPANYNFMPLLEAVKKYDYLMDFHKYKHNYDYQLALLIMNNKFFMTDGSLLFTENESIFAPVSQVNYSFYNSEDELMNMLANEDIQCVVGNKFTAFGKAQEPTLINYADGIDTMQFLTAL